jgi:paraquat-inducible protein A
MSDQNVKSDDPQAAVVGELHTLIVCEQCDAVYSRISFALDESAFCRQCGAVLCRGSRLTTRDLLALTFAAAILFVVANAAPAIRITVKGMHNEVTLWGAVAALWHGYAVVMGAVAGIALIAVPAIQIALLLWILSFAAFDRRAPGAAIGLRLLHAMRPWSMIEVFMLGVLVAIVKLSGLLHVVPGPGTYATMALAILLAVVAKRDVRSLWTRLPAS